MTNKVLGWSLAAASIGMLCLSIGADVKDLHSFNEATTPFFIGNMLGHVGNVLMAFVGGKLIPTEPQNQRVDDAKEPDKKP